MLGAPTITSPSPSPSRSPTAKAAPNSEPSQPDRLLFEPQPKESSSAPAGSDANEQSGEVVSGKSNSARPSITCTLTLSDTTRSASPSRLTLPPASARPKPGVPPKQPM